MEETLNFKYVDETILEQLLNKKNSNEELSNYAENLFKLGKLNEEIGNTDRA